MFKRYNTLYNTLGNEYPSSNETSKKNGTVRGDCIACDAFFFIHICVNRMSFKNIIKFEIEKFALYLHVLNKLGRAA